ncbi:MAG: hypothetical protein K6T30_01745, partial [Alicyclobacillus sp.]|nr:hypothetical protein [Alicyclobacillus sp.]
MAERRMAETAVAEQDKVRLWSGMARHWLPVCAVAACVIAAYPLVTSRLLPTFDDLARLNIPQRMLLGWFYRHGWLPLWNPYSFAGQPFLAAGQSGPLYLPNAVFAWLPVVPALRVSYLGHVLLAAVGMYGAAWHWTRRRAASAAAAVSFSASGFLVGHQIHTQMFEAMAWLPLAMWLLLRLLESPRPRRAAGLAIALAMQAYAGHPQVTFDTCFTLGVYVLVSAAQGIA